MMTSRIFSRRAAAALLTAGLVAAPALAAATPASAATTTSYAAGSAADTRQHARFYAGGYLWSDGWGTAPNYGFRSPQTVIANRFDLAARRLGATTTRSTSGTFDIVRTQGLYLRVPLTETPPMLKWSSTAQTKAFLAAVIECEGQLNGLVIDDPKRAHVEIMAQQLKRVGIRTRLEVAPGGGFYRLFAVKEDWPKFRTFPFVVWKRVPGAG